MWAPVAVIVIIAYIIACLFMEVWSMGADTLLQCLCVDRNLAKNKSGLSGVKKVDPDDPAAQCEIEKQLDNLTKYCPRDLLEIVQDGANSDTLKNLLAIQKAKKKRWD